MKKSLTEKTIQTYVDYLVDIRVKYGYNQYIEKFKTAMIAARETHSRTDVMKLKSAILQRIDIAYRNRFRQT